MRLLTVIITILLCLNVNAGEVEDNLKILDEEFEKFPQYVARRQQKVDSLTAIVDKAATTEARYEACKQLLRMYHHFQIDSAFHVAWQCDRLAHEMKDNNRIAESRIFLALLNAQEADPHRPFRILDSINVNSLSPQLKGEYYGSYTDICNMMMQYMSDYKMQMGFAKKLSTVRDSAVHYNPDNWLIAADLLFFKGEYKAAIDLVERKLADGHHDDEAGIAYNFLARIYEQLQNREMQEICLTKSAIADIRNGVREYKSLMDLALLLHEDGDYERAFRFMNQSLVDAQASNSRMRKIQIGRQAPMIAEAFEAQTQRTLRLGRMFNIAVVIFALVLAAGILLLIRKNRQLKSTRVALDDSNHKLKVANQKLADMNSKLTLANTELTAKNTEQAEQNDILAASNEVRRKYLVHVLRLYMEIINRMEKFRSNLSKVASKRNFDELYQAVREGRNIDEELEMSYAAFDEAFLHIYPNFVDQFNSLLQPDKQIQLKEGERLSTDLRIFALLRIGITDSAEVANYLRCSFSTVYNYRTKMRNRAINRDTFEDDVMHIQ